MRIKVKNLNFSRSFALINSYAKVWNNLSMLHTFETLTWFTKRLGKHPEVVCESLINRFEIKQIERFLDAFGLNWMNGRYSIRKSNRIALNRSKTVSLQLVRRLGLFSGRVVWANSENHQEIFYFKRYCIVLQILYFISSNNNPLFICV